jgi:transposase
LNFFQFKTYLHCRVPRTECDKCGIKQVKPTFRIKPALRSIFRIPVQVT